jgi:hypothetical protein
MPFKKNQSLTDINTENKKVSGGRFGLQWTPRAAFSRFGLRSDSKKSPPETARRVSSRAVASRYRRCLLEETTFCFPYKDDPLPKLELPG